MRDDITSIPISEVFEPKDGCPVCRLRDMLEERSVKYITGAAMMEPDVRIETNKQGFCRHHYGEMLKVGKKLTVALILQSHLAQVAGDGIAPLGKKETIKESCFICNKLERNMQQIVQNVCLLWDREKEFRSLYSEQPYICLNHCKMLLGAADRVAKRDRNDFIKITKALTVNELAALADDLQHFCDMFDYHNAGSDDWGNSKDSVERTVKYLTTRKMD